MWPRVLGFRELAEGDRELARKASGVRGKKTKRLVRRSSGVAEKLIGIAIEEERLLAGVGVAIYRDRGADSRKCGGYGQSRQRWNIRLAL
ncbi:hypothetical protein B296_00006961 [Ensete ventricosum]|uniref:Uncharacterized protein n=1 Tax=Ensete ventricosum TaxID=4639 RepID=A0A427AUB8_ENSVE|nr:hypothetical protein B296_00006961 [Ensete ventricosum]